MGRSINQNLYPSNTGYSFQDRDGSTHRSESWRMVEAVVRQYRQRKGEDPGDVWGEIMDQACARNSNLCQDTTPHQLVLSAPAGSNTYAGTMFQKVSNWLSGMMTRYQRREVRLVDRSEAARRAAICAPCPRQMTIPATCGSCHTQMATFRKAIIGGSSVNEGLAGCSALGEDTKLSVHLTLEPITVDGQPVNCWRKSG